MKKLLLLTLTLMFTLTALTGSFTAFAAEDIVKIEFCVGDDVLSINGEQVQVERPYVVGEGVTLVPLRVITEAFGATVEWIESTQSIDLKYPDVNIHLQIGNPIAEVNLKAETLLAAPELPDSTTMVPLRFISETFGATVSYDEATEKITVIKDNTSNGTGLVEGAVTSKYIGDSYYGWSIENPTDMQIDERYFDGLFTAFTYDDNNGFFIGIKQLSKDYDFERDFNTEKSSLQGFTLVKADKNADDPNGKKMHFQAKDKKRFIDAQIIIKDNLKYLVYGNFEFNNTALKNEYVRILSTFETKYKSNDIYDLSNVENGVRRFKADHLKFSMNIPENYYMASEEDAQNDFIFYNLTNEDYYSRISIHLTSKDAETTAKTLAEKDFAYNKSTVNEDIAIFHGVVRETQYDKLTAYEYTYDVNRSNGSSTHRDVFFELGDYIYNVHIAVQLPFDTYKSFMDSIINSISVEKLDSTEVGMLLRNDIESTGTYDSKVGNGTISVPNIYEESLQGNVAYYTNPSSGLAFSFQVIPTEGKSYSDVKNNLKSIEKSQKLVDGVEIITSTKDITCNGKTFAYMCMSNSDDYEKVYVEQYATLKNNVAYIFIASYPELVYSTHYKDEILNIINSLKIK